LHHGQLIYTTESSYHASSTHIGYLGGKLAILLLHHWVAALHHVHHHHLLHGVHRLRVGLSSKEALQIWYETFGLVIFLYRCGQASLS
jgi:hypothetical protein